ncbi:MAG: hypothetical protein ACJ74O_15940 [Frankiaceae bacterium]
MIDGDYTDEKAATLTGLFRQAAVNLAEQDGDFLRFYNDFGYHNIFGPLEALY